jgi:hypothetical protein
MKKCFDNLKRRQEYLFLQNDPSYQKEDEEKHTTATTKPKNVTSILLILVFVCCVINPD